MKWRMIGAVASASVLFGTTAFADYMIVDITGGCATDGSASNTGTRMPGSIGPALNQLAAAGNSVQKAGGGRYNFYINGCLEGYVIDLDEAEADGTGADGIGSGGTKSGSTGSGGGNPAASSSIAVNKVIRKNVFTQAKPKAKSQSKQSASPAAAQPEAATDESGQATFYKSFGHSGILAFGAADVFFNKWEIGDEDGETFGMNPSVTWGETQELTLTVPLHVINGDDDTIFGLGLDGAYKIPFTGQWKNFAAGVHAYGMGFFGGDETESTFGGGPFLAFNYRIDPQWILSVGGLLEFTKPDEGDTITELVPGVNLGYNLTDNVALNGYGIYYRNLDSDADDDGYADVGGDVSWSLGGWSLSAGAKTAVGMKNVDSTEIYLGSAWIF